MNPSPISSSPAKSPEPAAAPPPRAAAGSFSPLTEKLLFATRAAFDASEEASKALEACEHALDQLNAQQRNIDAARSSITAAITKLRNYERDLHSMSVAVLDRAVAAGDAKKPT